MEHISLASGSSHFRSPGAATAAAISALQAGKTFYGPTEGTLELRQAISNQYKKEGIDVTPEQVLITPGSKQALFNLFTILLCQGDEVVVPTPAWFGFHELMKYSKGMLVPLPTQLSENFALTPEALRKTLSSRSRILLLTNPGNPTGRTYTKDELEALLEVTKEFPNLYILSDEIYDRVTYNGSFTSLLSCEGAEKERVFLINGFSKSYAMSGWRMGYMIGPEEVIKKCVDFQGSTMSGVSVFSQDAALATLRKQEQALMPMLEVLAQNRQLMQDCLDEIPEVKYYAPDGAYYFFPDFSRYFGRLTTPSGETIANSVDFCRYLHEHYNLELKSGDYFGAPGHARMSFAVEAPKLKEAMQRLKQALVVVR